MCSSLPSARPILVADDESADVYIFRRALIAAGVTNPIIGVADGEELLRFLEGATFGGLIPQVLFLDVRMPGMSGLEALDEIRRHPLLRTLRVIMLSSSANEADRDRALALGADDYLVKFPSPGQLRALLDAPEMNLRFAAAG